MSELEVLESIYPDYIVSIGPSNASLKLEIPVDLSGPSNVVLVPSGPSAEEPLSLSLTTLPPILLDVILSAAYPAGAPPEISIRSSHIWLPHLLVSRLRDTLMQMWQPGDGVLYDWVEFIRSGEFLNSIELMSPNGSITIPHPTPHRLGPLLKSCDDSARSASFSAGSYPCAVCLESIKGSKCLQLSCKHVFCRSCLLDLLGSVETLGCPDPECVKMGRQSSEEEIARVVPEEAVQRWRWLKEKIMFEKDPSLVHCPIPSCQFPVPKPPELDGDYRGNRLRTCASCSFSFCAFCKRTWHGAVQECPISHAENVVLEYLALEEGSKERELMELRFGKTIMKKLVNRYQEEQLNKQWLAASTMACAGCSVAVEKSLGCNHMQCSRCKIHFCYRCGHKLPPTDPYTHFSTPGHPCYSKLFDFVSEDHQWQPFN
ncbi:hypothetical protein C8J57DRAFT_1268781 [Mycena rebaudengoi]|nr:hypothetical protein C8J57DRAFT_1268781 [Mycena rebaudengoi]